MFSLFISLKKKKREGGGERENGESGERASSKSRVMIQGDENTLAQPRVVSVVKTTGVQWQLVIYAETHRVLIRLTFKYFKLI